MPGIVSAGMYRCINDKLVTATVQLLVQTNRYVFWLPFSYNQGCAEKLDTWMRSTASILIVIGYCVIAFLKLTFLGILRYEIKEMIQKIKLLQTELATSILGAAPADVEQQQVSKQMHGQFPNFLLPKIIFLKCLWLYILRFSEKLELRSIANTQHNSE